MSNIENSKDTPVQNESTVESNGSQTTEPSQAVQPQITQQVEQPQAHHQNVQPQVVGQQAIKDVPKKKKFGLFECIIGALVVFGGGYSAMNYFDWKPSFSKGQSTAFEGAKVVVVNTDVLISAVSLKVMNEPNGSEKISIMIEKIYQEIDAFAQDGYIVIDSDTPILYSPKADVTKVIAEKIGVDAYEGYKVAKENRFIGNAGRASLEIKADKKDSANSNVQHEDFSNLDLNTNEKGETMDLDLE